MSVRTLIVDDHQLFGAGLQLLLRATDGLGEVDCAASGAQALQRASVQDYELVMLDWHLGREPSGEALIARLRELLPRARVVVVSGEVQPDLVRRAIDAGAVGFVPKESSPEAMIRALSVVAAGGISLPPVALAAEAAQTPPAPGMRDSASAHGPAAMSGDIGAAFPQLTRRHVEVLSRIVRGLSNKEIARELGIAEGTVKQHAYAIFRELGLQNRTEAVYLLARLGVRFQ